MHLLDRVPKKRLFGLNAKDEVPLVRGIKGQPDFDFNTGRISIENLAVCITAFPRSDELSAHPRVPSAFPCQYGGETGIDLVTSGLLGGLAPVRKLRTSCL